MELEAQQESKDELGNLPFSPPPMKKSETRDSISSVDSDVSLSFDRRGSKSEEADLSDYDSEIIRSAKGINTERDSGADDSVDYVTSKELENLEQSDMQFRLTEKTTNNLDTLNDELADKICAQVEFYFSDENILKDAFLLKHVKRNKEGYVSLKLISSFKRVKHLSRDWRVVGAALARSKKLEVNPQGTKLRRVDPLPSFDQTVPSRTILVARLPVQKLTVESVAEVFKSCGEIALIRILRPGHTTPSEVRQAISKRPELIFNEEYAMIEFTDSISVRIAMQMTLGNAKIFELHQSTDKKRRQQYTKKNVLSKISKENNYNSSSCPSGSETEDKKIRHKKSIQRCPTYRIYTNYPCQGLPSPDVWLSRKFSSCSISNGDNGFIFRRLSSCSGSSSDSGRRYSTCSSGSEAALFYPDYSNTFYHNENRRYSCCSSTGSSVEYEKGGYIANRRGSAEYESFLRRLSICNRDSDYDTNTRRSSLCSPNSEQNEFYRSRINNNGIAMMHLPENVARMPAGPDGTRGFFSRSTKMFVKSTCRVP